LCLDLCLLRIIFQKFTAINFYVLIEVGTEFSY